MTCKEQRAKYLFQYHETMSVVTVQRRLRVLLFREVWLQVFVYKWCMLHTDSDYIHEGSCKRPVAGVVVRVFESTFVRSLRKSTKEFSRKSRNPHSIECKILCSFFLFSDLKVRNTVCCKVQLPKTSDFAIHGAVTFFQNLEATTCQNLFQWCRHFLFLQAR